MTMLQRLAPASALPNELLRAIFLFANGEASVCHPPEEASEGWLLSVRLSHVCRQWRMTAIAAEKLWTSITVRSPRTGNLVPLFAERAGSSRLSAAFLSQSQRLWEEPWAMVPFSPSQCSRVRELKFGAPESHRALRDPMDQDRDVGPLDSLTFKRHIPPIEDLRQFSSARILFIDECSLHSDGVISQLAMPRLEKLTMRTVKIDEVAYCMELLNAPKLSHLRIIDGDGLPSDSILDEDELPPLSLADFPALEALSIIRTSPQFWTLFRDVAEGGLSGIFVLDITTDALVGEILDEDDIRGLLSFFTSLEYLRVGTQLSTLEMVLRALSLKPNNVIPHVHTLQLEILGASYYTPQDTDLRHQGMHSPSQQTLKALKSRIRKAVTAAPTRRGTGTRLLDGLKMTRELVGDNEDWFRNRIPEFSVLEGERILKE
ncbi:hypothetical protein DL93DRAFT_2172742 [Clavulina sp. PMI_390]|nr:hypothetical protein DL93DRAFT_2172742 [Clavulina sp. PMI_390]